MDECRAIGAAIEDSDQKSVLIESQPRAAGAQIPTCDDFGVGGDEARRRCGSVVALVAVRSHQEGIPVKNIKKKRQSTHPLRLLQKAPAMCKHALLLSLNVYVSFGKLERKTMFQSVDDVIAGLGGQNYICGKSVATVVYLGAALQKPILVEGPAGVGKTELGKVLAGSLGLELIRLQCYEGLDEAKALYEWEYAKQLLYTQILKDKIGEITKGSETLQEAVNSIAAQDGVFFSDRFLLPRPLLRALLAEKPTVLLIDEVDKSDSEFEAFLLEVLSDFQITVPEIGTLKAKHIPLVVLTSNNSREMSDALKRRCLHLYLDFPDSEREMEIIKLKVPGVGSQLVQEVVRLLQRLRKLDLKKTPSISESLDWVKALALLNIKQLDHELVDQTLSVLMKYEADIRKAHQELKAYLAERKAQRGAARGGDEDHLH
jgi:MoxR-like ATPase